MLQRKKSFCILQGFFFINIEATAMEEVVSVAGTPSGNDRAEVIFL